MYGCGAVYKKRLRGKVMTWSLTIFGCIYHHPFICLLACLLLILSSFPEPDNFAFVVRK